MKLTCNRYVSQIDFDKSTKYILVVENAKEFRKICCELLAESNGETESDFVFSDNGQIVSMQKYILLLYDFLGLDINNKKILNEVASQVEEKLQTYDFVEKLCQINKLILEINDKVLDDFDFKVSYDEEFGIDKLIKISNYRIQGASDILEKLLAYIKVYSSLKPIKTIVLIGVMQYLSADELYLFAKNLEYLGLNLLLVERQDYKLKNFNRILIDNDLCEI